MYMVNKTKRQYDEKGTSLIESAIVLVLSVASVSGVLYYYNDMQGEQKVWRGLKQKQIISAAINKLYSNSSTQMNNLNDVVEAIFVVPDVSIVQPGLTEIFFYIISKLHRVLVVRRN